MTPIVEISPFCAVVRTITRFEGRPFVRLTLRRSARRVFPALVLGVCLLSPVAAPVPLRAAELPPFPVEALEPVAAPLAPFMEVAAPLSQPTTDALPAAPLFPKVRAISLEQARAIALKRSPTLALSSARFASAQADERDVSRRIKVNSAGGLDPFSGQIRFYLSLDLERLAGLNKAERQSARQKVEAQRLAGVSAEQDALKRVSSAWYALTSAQMSVESAARRKQSAGALFVANDARFRAGQGELAGTLSSMNASFEAEDTFQSARQSVALACLELAQSCGYMTAEEMEADI